MAATAAIALVRQEAASTPSVPAPILLEDTEGLLQRTRNRLLNDLDNMPRYTCIQTITRRYYGPERRWWNGPGSCADLAAAHEKRTRDLPLTGWDRLRLDVAIVGPREVFAWAGASKFGETSIDDLAEGGPAASGDFGPYLGSVFDLATMIKFHGERVIAGRRHFEYWYDVPVAASKYVVRSPSGTFKTGYHGSLLLHPEQADIRHLMIYTSELPSGTGACEAISDVEYQRTPIHGRALLVPRETNLLVLRRDGGETSNSTSYAGCHEYGSTFTIRYNVDERPGGELQSPPTGQAPPTAFPEGIRFSARIVTPLDPDSAAAGDPIDAVLTSTIRSKGIILAERGAKIHGRLLRFAYLATSDQHFEVELRLESLENKNMLAPLRATREPMGAMPLRFRLMPQADPTRALFILDRSALLRGGYISNWVTVAVKPEQANHNGNEQH